jgi:hypothetical protein
MTSCIFNVFETSADQINADWPQSIKDFANGLNVAPLYVTGTIDRRRALAFEHLIVGIRKQDGRLATPPERPWSGLRATAM